MHPRHMLSSLLSLLALLTLGGCSYEKQLTRVAKDWCMTIRAAQVVPVYPLTEDLQPGDVFLVTLPSNEQQAAYREKGFLPLDVPVARLSLSTPQFDAFYGPGYFASTYASNGTGHQRLTRTNTEEAFANSFSVPRAVFPTYTVDVRRSGGFKAAIPIQSIPVGASLLAADSAVASIDLADAYTYGAQPADIDGALRRWAEDPANKQRLVEFGRGRPESQPLFLRVVLRVYLTGGVTASITRTSTTSSGLDAGKAQDVALLNPADASSIERFAAAQSALRGSLNESLANSVPGASIRLVTASQRSITLNERFDRPLAVGYIGLDYEVRPDGSLGAALSTRDVLAGRQAYPITRDPSNMFTPLDRSIMDMHDALVTLAKGTPAEQERAASIINAFLQSHVASGDAYAELRAQPATAANALAAARKLAIANNAHRAGEFGDGLKTRQIDGALRNAFLAHPGA